MEPSYHHITSTSPIMIGTLLQRPCIAEAASMNLSKEDSKIQKSAINHSISLNICESTILERRVLPSLRLPISNSTMSLSRRSPTAGSERSDSYSYPRRSVTGMKKLMPLRLGSPLSSPLSDFDSAFTDAPDSFNIIYEQKQDPTDSRYIPWMQCERESPLLSELDSTKFRETPIYSKPGSPFLARAYFGGDEDCFKFPPPKSTCQTVRIVESDDDIGDMQSPQLEYYADYAESLDGESEADSERSEHKSPDATLTSLEPSRQSGLSIMCRGLDQYKRNTLGIEFMPVPPLAAAFLDREDSIIQRRPDESWIDSDSSRCSSPTCPTQILDVSRLSSGPGQD